MQELVASNPEPRNWRANIISVNSKILCSDWLIILNTDL